MASATMMVFSGLRGPVAFALVMNVPAYDVVLGTGTKYKPILLTATAAVIITQIFVHGTLALPFLKFLSISSGDDADAPDTLNTAFIARRRTGRNTNGQSESDRSNSDGSARRTAPALGVGCLSCIHNRILGPLLLRREGWEEKDNNDADADPTAAHRQRDREQSLPGLDYGSI